MKMAATKFKASCLELMDRVASTGEEVVITKRGKPVAKLVGVRRKDRGEKTGHGCMRGTILASAPIETLFSTGAWDADD
jgi:prevent-host-death family protein